MSDETTDEALTPSSAPEVIRGGLQTREDYAEAINETYRETVEGIFRMGRLLEEAKQELPHGEFGPMVEQDLPFGTRSARRLMAVARDGRLWNRTRASDLPPSWSTLYRLTRLDDHEWERIEPHISPDLRRAEIPKLVSQGSQLPLMSDEERDGREKLEAALQGLPAGERGTVESLLARRRVPLPKRIRVVRALADVPRSERELFYQAAEAEDPEEREPRAVQIKLQSFDVGEPDDLRGGRARVLSTPEDGGPEFESPRVEEAMPVFALQALLRWATAFCDAVATAAVLDGLWVARSRRKIAANARRVADWLTELAERAEDEGE